MDTDDVRCETKSLFPFNSLRLTPSPQGDLQLDEALVSPGPQRFTCSLIALSLRGQPRLISLFSVQGSLIRNSPDSSYSCVSLMNRDTVIWEVRQGMPGPTPDNWELGLGSIEESPAFPSLALWVLSVSGARKSSHKLLMNYEGWVTTTQHLDFSSTSLLQTFTASQLLLMLQLSVCWQHFLSIGLCCWGTLTLGPQLRSPDKHLRHWYSR